MENELSMHLRVGLPSKAIDSSRALAITRAAEAYNLITMLMDLPNNQLQEYDYNWASPLAGQYNRTSDNRLQRGFVRLSIDRWKTPVAAHDLEIRRYSSIQRSLELIGLVSTLSEQHQRLIIISKNFGKTSSDTKLGNLEGALIYLRELFAQQESTPTRFIQALDRLIKLAREHPNKDSTRAEIRRSIVRMKLLEKIKIDLFLMPNTGE
jgi:hypothetical protein